MLIKKPADIRPSEITGKSVFRQRRKFLKLAAAAGLGAVAVPALTMGRKPKEEPLTSPSTSSTGDAPPPLPERQKMSGVVETPYGQGLKLTDYEDVTGYNNFYEFGASKKDPARFAGSLQTRPWTIEVEGECEAPGVLDIEQVLSGFPQQERIYRFRCVEAWAMVVPWVGVPLADVLKRFKPTSRAKYVAFETLHDPKQMPAQRRRVLDWPYREGLRIDEAMHPLALLATGVYGELLPNQNGAPLRLVLPWKYGFKSIKSIVSIRFTEELPETTWWKMGPDEYGFYANVNPHVDHPRWSQARHRMIGESVFSAKQETGMFNGYAEQVADLYRGMDLRKLF